jgi:ornithine cyclodeaminase/alanine dehydrogenase-like protein (mu-crystallin family)
MNSTTPAYVLDHVGLAVGDLVASWDFYEQALAPLGFAAGRRAG